jgi:hypothetical protein
MFFFANMIKDMDPTPQNIPLISLTPGAKNQCIQANSFMKSNWGIALLVLLIVFVAAFVIFWFVNPDWVQKKDATGSPTGVADFGLTAGYSIAGAAGASVLYLLVSTWLWK